MQDSVRGQSENEQILSSCPPSSRSVSWLMLLAGALAFGLIGTWLVWFSVVVQRRFNEEDVRMACQRLMPETVERCYDTVVIQRGGVRR